MSLICALAAMTAVYSCYNDADLKQSIDELDGRVEALEQFRDQVQSEIASLSEILNKLQSSATINNVVANSNGSYTINFSDGTSVTIKDGEDGEDGLTPPSLTLVQGEDGEYYWAWENEDGSFDFIQDDQGNRIPATGPDLMVRINSQTGFWEISYDGGQSWVDTGMPSTGGTGGDLITGITEDENNVYFHLRGGTVIAVPKTAELALEFVTDEETLYFAAGESRSISYVMSGASEVAVDKPDGWKASFEGDSFIITAPVADNIYAETEGTVSVFVTATNGQSLIASLNVAIDGGAGGDYDYDIELTVFNGTYYSTMFAVTHNYYTTLSDMPFDADGYSQNGGTYYILDLYAGEPADGNNPMLPEGTYSVDYSGTYPAMTFNGSISSGLSTTLDGDVIFNVDFTDGTLDVSYEGDNIIIEGVLTDDAGKTHHIYYNGPASYENYGSGGGDDDGTIQEDIHIDAMTATSTYYSGGTDQMCLILQFSDLTDGMAPGTVLTVETYMNRNAEGYITPGEYTVDGSGDPFTLYPGDNFMGFLLLGTYAQQYDEYGNEAFGFISEGTMNVSGGEGNYTITCDFTTLEGYSITAEWSGTLETQGMPTDYFSTLTGDYTLDLEGAVAEAMEYGDYYGTGGTNWMINLLPGTCTDGIQIDMTAEGFDTSTGIPSGTYTASAGNPAPGEYLPGYMDGNTLYGTVYVGDFTEDGYVQAFAPATSGDLVITNHGDGTYDISFSFLDDNGNTWDGQWSGPISISTQSYSNSQRSSAKSAAPTPEERAALLEQYGINITGAAGVQKGLRTR